MDNQQHSVDASPRLPVPDVGRAIHVNHIDPDVDPERRMSALDAQRRETYAIRELWRSLQERRDRRSRLNRTTYDVPVNTVDDAALCIKGPYRCNGSGPYLERSKTFAGPKTSARKYGAATDRGDYYAATRHRGLAERGHETARYAESAPAGIRKQFRDEDIPYHTAITMPPDRRMESLKKFNALNRKLACPLPDIYDTGYRPPGYSERDIRVWKEEIRKVVPERPQLFQPTRIRFRPLSDIMPPKSDRPYDTSVMFRPTLKPRSGKHQEYVVDPEWFSERITPESVQNRAHFVYTWGL